MNPRPTIHDDSVIKAAAKALAPKVANWCEPPAMDDLDEIEKDLAKAMQWDCDGYKLARDLDSYCPDAALVEILDEAGSLKSNALRKAMEAWTAETNPEAPDLESRVTWTKHQDYGIGIVTRNWPDGRATVCFQDKGHVREGQGSHGYIVEWEQLKPHRGGRAMNLSQTVWWIPVGERLPEKSQPVLTGGRHER